MSNAPEYSIGGLVTFPQLSAGYGLISGVIGAASLVRTRTTLPAGVTGTRRLKVASCARAWWVGSRVACRSIRISATTWWASPRGGCPCWSRPPACTRSGSSGTNCSVGAVGVIVWQWGNHRPHRNSCVQPSDSGAGGHHCAFGLLCPGFEAPPANEQRPGGPQHRQYAVSAHRPSRSLLTRDDAVVAVVRQMACWQRGCTGKASSTRWASRFTQA